MRYIGYRIKIPSAAGTYTLKLEWDDTGSTSYTLGAVAKHKI